MKTVNLVATERAIRAAFPGAREPRQTSPDRLMSADFAIDYAACTTALGRWLAEQIPTTRFDDDASLCVLLLPVTEEGLEARIFLKSLLEDPATARMRSYDDMLQFHEKMHSWIARRAKLHAMYGELLFKYRLSDFRWPVYGSQAAMGADTPERYFDLCARQIRETGGVIVYAGLRKTRLPESIAATMAGNRGLELLREFVNSTQGRSYAAEYAERGQVSQSLAGRP